MITNVKKLLDKNILFQPKIHCSNGPFSISNEMSADEFVSRPICAIASCIPIVHRFTRKIHAQKREQKISCFFVFVFFFQPVRKTVIAMKTDLVTNHLYL